MWTIRIIRTIRTIRIFDWKLFYIRSSTIPIRIGNPSPGLAHFQNILHTILVKTHKFQWCFQEKRHGGDLSSRDVFLKIRLWIFTLHSLSCYSLQRLLLKIVPKVLGLWRKGSPLSNTFGHEFDILFLNK